MVKRSAILILATVAGACGGGGDDGGALVGRWELHDDETGELEAEIELTGDGSFTFEEHGQAPERNQGTYQADGELLTMDGTNEDGEDARAEVTYHVDDQRLIIGALLPAGDVNGPVGIWSGRVYSEIAGEVELDLETTYRLAADGSATVIAENGGRSERFEGTWAEEEVDGVVVTVEADGITVNVHMLLVEGAALGSPVYRRAGD